MLLNPILCPAIAALMLTGCAHSQPPSVRQIPLLDSTLSLPCPQLSEPPSGDYDVLQNWMQDDVLKKYGICAARHAATVAAWPK